MERQRQVVGRRPLEILLPVMAKYIVAATARARAADLVALTAVHNIAMAEVVVPSLSLALPLALPLAWSAIEVRPVVASASATLAVHCFAVRLAHVRKHRRHLFERMGAMAGPQSLAVATTMAAASSHAKLVRLILELQPKNRYSEEELRSTSRWSL